MLESPNIHAQVSQVYCPEQELEDQVVWGRLGGGSVGCAGLRPRGQVPMVGEESFCDLVFFFTSGWWSGLVFFFTVV